MFEARQICRAKGICLSNDGNEIDSRAQAFHDFDVQRLQGVASGSDEVEAGMYSQIDLVDPTGLLLLQHVGLVLVIKKLDNRHP